MVENIFEQLSFKARKTLSHGGGIRTSSLDVGAPALYASTWEVRLDDGGVIFTRDPGDALWACTFDDLMTQWRISNAVVASEYIVC